MKADKNQLCDELTEAFIEYQWNLENPFQLKPVTKEEKIFHYHSDVFFNRKVKALVYGVMGIVDKYI